jgi:hypothetical protein
MGNLFSCTPETRKRVCTIGSAAATAGIKAGIAEAQKDNDPNESAPTESVPANSVSFEDYDSD